MMQVVGLIVMLLILVVGGAYIHVMHQIGKLEIAVKDAGSEIDGLLWDRNHQLDEMLKVLELEKIPHSIIRTRTDLMGLGMVTSLQMEVCRQLDEKDEELQEVLRAHEGLSERPEIQEHLKKFNDSRTQLIGAALTYNNKVRVYNGFISQGLISAIARHRGKNRRTYFNYIFQKNNGEEG